MVVRGYLSVLLTGWFTRSMGFLIMWSRLFETDHPHWVYTEFPAVHIILFDICGVASSLKHSCTHDVFGVELKSLNLERGTFHTVHKRTSVLPKEFTLC